MKEEKLVNMKRQVSAKRNIMLRLFGMKEKFGRNIRSEAESNKGIKAFNQYSWYLSQVDLYDSEVLLLTRPIFLQP